MNIQAQNLFIVNANETMAHGLKIFLTKQFGSTMVISTFKSGTSALKSIDANTCIVVLDNNLPGEKGHELLSTIKTINAKTEIIMISAHEDVAKAVEAYRRGANDYVIMGNDRAWKKIASIVYKIVVYPVRILVQEFGVSKFAAIFLSVFATIGLLVFFVLKMIK